MIKIGMIGADSSHSSAFSELANLPGKNGSYLYNDVRVTAIWGESPERAMEVAAKCNIPCVVKTPEEMLGMVDAVMIVLRRGSQHKSYAMPFIAKGIAVWVDKPFSISSLDALDMVNCAKKQQSILAGGSTCKYCFDVLTLQSEFLNLQKNDKVISGAFNFPGEIDSPYDGIYFYGGHAAEMLTTIFGNEVRSVKTDVHQKNIIALFRYDDFTVTVNFSEVSDFYGQIYAPSRVVVQRIDISTVYRNGFDKFVTALRTKQVQEPLESLLLPVAILNALEKSILSGKEVSIQPLKMEG